MTSMTKTGTTATSTVERALKPPMQDSEVASTMQKLGVAIKNIAQSHYAPNAGDLSGDRTEPINRDRLALLLGTSAPTKPREMARLLASPQSRIAAVRQLMAWAVLGGTTLGGHLSLLPPELAKCLSVMHSKHTDEHGKITQHSSVHCKS